MLKNGIRKKYRRLPAHNNYNQYKLSGLREGGNFELWITATNRRGEGNYLFLDLINLVSFKFS